MIHQTPEDKAINRRVYGGLNHYARAYNIDVRSGLSTTDTELGYLITEYSNAVAAARIGFVTFFKHGLFR